MSQSSTEDLTARAREKAKAKALESFAFHDNDAVPLNVPPAGALSILKAGSAIIVTGYIPVDAVRFSVNLTCRTSGNLALHFNPRLERAYVVRNSRIRGIWREEETCSPPGPNGQIFRRNSYFHIMIFCTPNEYQIAVDGEHFCSFAYRIPLEDVVGIQVDGNVEEVRTRQTYFYIYPDPKICRPIRNLQVVQDCPLNQNLALPLTASIINGIREGSQLFIHGRLKLLPHSFYVNLQKGRTIYPHPEIALHLNPRFLFGTAPPCVVMNCWSEGSWSDEERHAGVFSWGPGRDFLLTISCESSAYTIWVDKKMVGEFRHRIPTTSVDTLRITGDIVLHQITINHA